MRDLTALFLLPTSALYTVSFTSQNQGLNGEYHLHDSSHNGRPTFIRRASMIEGSKYVFLYHAQVQERAHNNSELSEGAGQWVVSTKVADGTNPLAIVKSWAITPCMLSSTAR